MSASTYDRVYRDILLVDGTGGEPTRADVAISGERIAKVSQPNTLTGNHEITGDSRALAPGFIDIHSHADLPLLIDGRAHSAVTQGITTMVPGNCGKNIGAIGHEPMPSVPPNILAEIGEVSTFAKYVDRLRERRVGVNVVPLVAHGSMRSAVAGMADRELTNQEIATMRAMVAEAMDAGAAGLSSGLEYSPGIASTTAELAAIAAPVGERGGFYATHCRNRSDRIVEAAEEAVYICETAGCRLEMSHFLRRPTGPDRSLEQRAWQYIRDADARGIRSRFDVFPFTYGPSPLAMFVPQKFRAEAGDNFAERLQNPAFVERILDDLDARFIAMLEQGIAADMYISNDGNTNEYVGMTLGAVAERWHTDVPRAMLKLMADAGPRFGTVYINERWADSADVSEAMRQPDFVIMGDGSMANLDGPLKGQGFALSDWGFATAALGTYVRELKQVSLQEAVRRLTSAPAEQIGLNNRGVIAESYAADLVLFDPSTVGSAVRPDELTVVSTGVDEVLVNGVPVLEHGQITNATPGRVGLPDVQR